jgi:hypothetical protein
MKVENPWYKRWWVIALFFIAIIVIGRNLKHPPTQNDATQNKANITYSEADTASNAKARAVAIGMETFINAYDGLPCSAYAVGSTVEFRVKFPEATNSVMMEAYAKKIASLIQGSDAIRKDPSISITLHFKMEKPGDWGIPYETKYAVGRTK